MPPYLSSIYHMELRKFCFYHAVKFPDLVPCSVPGCLLWREPGAMVPEFVYGWVKEKKVVG